MPQYAWQKQQSSLLAEVAEALQIILHADVALLYDGRMDGKPAQAERERMHLTFGASQTYSSKQYK